MVQDSALSIVGNYCFAISFDLNNQIKGSYGYIKMVTSIEAKRIEIPRFTVK